MFTFGLESDTVREVLDRLHLILHFKDVDGCDPSATSVTTHYKHTLLIDPELTVSWFQNRGLHLDVLSVGV